MSAAPPQYSKDGTWWWDGGKWVPAADAPVDAGAPPATDWEVVDTEGGPVTLATLGDLRSRVAALNAWIRQLSDRAQTVRADADRVFQSAGSTLVARRSDWSPPAELEPLIGQAAQLAQRVEADRQQNQAARAGETSQGFLAKVGAHHHEHQLEHDQAGAEASLNPLLVQVGRSAPATAIPDVESERSRGSSLDTRAAELTKRADEAQAEVSALQNQIAQREEALNQMGFDSLYESAALQTSGPTVVQSPLVLKAGEKAYLATPATLARMTSSTRFVGGSSGFSFPIGHTGIRYRVGSYRGHPVQQESLKHLDVGTLVLTGQRLAYVGATKSVAVPLGKILHVEVYNDGISVAHEGKENPDFFLISEPQHAVFLLNWFLSQASGTNLPS